MDPEKMTPEELALVLNIHEGTIKKLAKTKQLPCLRLKNRMYFSFKEILVFFRDMETLSLEGGTA